MPNESPLSITTGIYSENRAEAGSYSYLAALKIISAEYQISSPSVEKCPSPSLPEFAFIGRSNVGKSSLINMVSGKVHLAKTSASPGKTQLINHFLVKAEDEKGKRVYQWQLVDLPGYGYAKVAQSKRKQWTKMIEQYIRLRENLLHLFVLIDIRHRPQAIDIAFVNQLGNWQIPFSIVFTKADKTTQREGAAAVKEFLAALEATWEELPKHAISSAVKGRGRKEILQTIEEVIVANDRIHMK
jgi:GTP-binding protein